MADEKEVFKRPAVLDEMDENFNTAPIEESGGILEGILAEQSGLTRTKEAPITETVEAEAPKKELPNDYLPLNSSIQELNNKVDQRLTGIERTLTQRLDNLNSYQQRQQPQQQQYQPTQQYDPDMPLTASHLNPVNERLNASDQMALAAYVSSQVTRAHIEYERYKRNNPNFDMDPQEIDHAIGLKVQRGEWKDLANTNWRGHFDQLYRPKLDGKLQEYEKQLADLRKENETLKKRPSAPTPSTPISPAVGRSTTRAIESPVNEMDSSILDMKEFKQKGNFKGFGKRITQKLQTR